MSGEEKSIYWHHLPNNASLVLSEIYGNHWVVIHLLKIIMDFKLSMCHLCLPPNTVNHEKQTFRITITLFLEQILIWMTCCFVRLEAQLLQLQYDHDHCFLLYLEEHSFQSVCYTKKFYVFQEWIKILFHQSNLVFLHMPECDPHSNLYNTWGY